MSVVFCKTPKGQEEISTRSGGLTPRIRRVLIMIDGKRSIDELRELALADDLTHTLGQLEEAGYIALLAGSAPRQADGGLASINSFRPLPEPINRMELEMARNFMTNTVRSFCGAYTHIPLQETLAQASTHEDLREQFGPWFNALVESREGKRRAEELRAELLKII